MSHPKRPDSQPGLTREQAVNLIISSIALEEMGLSHIINAEGEKLQYVLGTLQDGGTLDQPITVDELLSLNQSIRSTLEGTMRNQLMLTSKLQSVLRTPTMVGPPGPVGTILGSFDTLAQLESAHPTGKVGDTYLVAGYMYVWDQASEAWLCVGSLHGPQGVPGPAGPRGPQGETGIDGAPGPQGIQGVAGTVGTIKGSYQTLAELIAAHPDGGQPGDFFYINPDLYVWDDDNNDWFNAGQIAGPQGLQGIQGQRGPAGPTGPQGPAGQLDPDTQLWHLQSGTVQRTVRLGDTVTLGSDSLDITLSDGPNVRIESIGTLLPRCSGDTFTLTTGIDGKRFRNIIVGNGSTSSITTTQTTLDTSGLPDLSIPMPCAGHLKSISLCFELVTNTIIIWNARTTVTAQVYVSAHPSNNVFVPLEGASVQFAVPFDSPAGTNFQLTTGLDAQLSAGDRVMLVLFSDTTPEYGAGTTISGKFCATLQIV